MPERVGHSKGSVGLVTPNFGNNSAPVGWCVFSRMLEGAVPGSIYVFVGLMSNPGGEVFDMHFHITLATTAPALVFRAEKNQRRTVGFLTIGAPLPECPTRSGIFLVRAKPNRCLRSNTLGEDFA